MIDTAEKAKIGNTIRNGRENKGLT